MELEALLKLNTDERIEEIRSQKKSIPFSEYEKQYDSNKHDIHDKGKRPPKLIKTDKGDRLVDISRLSMPFQEIIVDRAVAFLVGAGIKLQAQPDTDQEQLIYDMIDKTWFDNKCDYKTSQLAREWMSLTECAELWYFKETEDAWNGLELGNGGGKYTFNMQILSHSNGDSLYPYYDEYKDLIAFGRGYKVGDNERFDLYTKNKIYRYSKDTNWTVQEEVNILGKIPIIYHPKNKTEWANVQHLINRFETMLSNFADSNDYFASPMVKIKGVVHGFAEKGETGKLIQMEENADASYLTWDQAPEAIKLEKETLQELIFSMTQTPDISFAQMKGIGNISGVALKLMFLDADLKAKKHAETFGEGMQRRVNLMKKAMAIISTKVEQAASLQIEPQFTFYLPENTQELINMLVTATGNRPIMSQKNAVSQNPFVIDPEKEMEQINDDQAGEFGNIFDEA